MGWWWLKWNVGGAFAISQVSTHLGQWPKVSAIDGHLTQTVIYKMLILPWHGKYLVISAAVPPDPFTRYVLRSGNIWANRRQQTNTNWFKRFPILEMIMCTFKTTLSRRDETTNAHLPPFFFFLNDKNNTQEFLIKVGSQWSCFFCVANTSKVWETNR